MRLYLCAVALLALISFAGCAAMDKAAQGVQVASTQPAFEAPVAVAGSGVFGGPGEIAAGAATLIVAAAGYYLKRRNSSLASALTDTANALQAQNPAAAASVHAGVAQATRVEIAKVLPSVPPAPVAALASAQTLTAQLLSGVTDAPSKPSAPQTAANPA